MKRAILRHTRPDFFRESKNEWFAPNSWLWKKVLDFVDSTRASTCGIVYITNISQRYTLDTRRKLDPNFFFFQTLFFSNTFSSSPTSLLRKLTRPSFLAVSEAANSPYIGILTWLRGFLVIFLYLVWFSLCSSLFWELRDNGVVKICNFDPKASESR